MNAKEMFEALPKGKWFYEDREKSLTWHNDRYCIVFYKPSDVYGDGKRYYVDSNFHMTMELHNAITQQLKELGWIE